MDGVNLGQVLSRGALTAGTFFVDEGAGELVVMPPVGVDLNAVDVEVGTRGTLVRLQGMGNVVLKGLVFTHAASVFREAAVSIAEDSDVLLDGVAVEWNGQNGLDLMGRGLTVRDSTFNHNGSSGLQAYKVAGVQVVDSEASYNNWRGVRGGYTSWEVGQKFSAAHRVSFTNFTSTHNQSRGLWLDTDDADVTLDGAKLCDNLKDGLFVESNQGPITVRNSTFCSNGETGLLTSRSAHLTFTGNTFRNDAVAEMNFSGDFGGTVTDWETGQTYNLENVGWSFRDNTVQNTAGKPLVGTTFPPSAWSGLMSSSTFDHNTYRASRRSVFQIGGGSFVDFTSWKTSTRQDAASAFTLTSTP
ncbi:MAG: right-handed parallel beta-helix repeat-containing protein [Deinococcales bacterium]